MDRICSEYFHLSISDWEIHSEELNRHGVDKAVHCNQLRLLQNILHFFQSVQISGFRWLHLTDALNYAIAMLQSPVQWQGVWSSAIFIVIMCTCICSENEKKQTNGKYCTWFVNDKQCTRPQSNSNLWHNGFQMQKLSIRLRLWTKSELTKSKCELCWTNKKYFSPKVPSKINWENELSNCICTIVEVYLLDTTRSTR